MRLPGVVVGCLLAGLTAVFSSNACSRSCFRHTDCSGGATCEDGVCVIRVERVTTDAASVEPVTEPVPEAAPTDGGATQQQGDGSAI